MISNERKLPIAYFFENEIKAIKERIKPVYCQNHSYKCLKAVGNEVEELIRLVTFDIVSKIKASKNDTELEENYITLKNILSVHLDDGFISMLPPLTKSKGGLVKNHEVNFNKHFDLKTIKSKYFKYLMEQLYKLSQIKRKVGDKKGARKYASLDIMKIRSEQVESHNEFLKNTKLSNGKTVFDYKKTDRNKLIELYLQAKGLQDIAIEKGYRWLFITLTLDSHFHSNPTLGKNSWDGSSVRDGKNWIQAQLRKLRTKAKDDNKQFSLENAFGIRVSEPMKDGTPHEHIMIFTKESDHEYYSNLFYQYFGRKVKTKIGFNEIEVVQGCKIVVEDTNDENEKYERGIASAASYILKYCLKGMSLNQLESKFANFSDIDAINAWKSANRIRSVALLGIKSTKTKYNDCRKIANYARNKSANSMISPDGVIRELATLWSRSDYTSKSSNVTFYNFIQSKNLRKAIVDAERLVTLVNVASNKINGKTDMRRFIKHADELTYTKHLQETRLGEIKKVNFEIGVGSAVINLKSIKMIKVVNPRKKIKTNAI